MNYEERIWSTLEPVSSLTPVYIWDSGNELWEKYENGELRHYRIIKRVLLSDDRMKEVLERMEESAIPKEIYAKHQRKDFKWNVEKEGEKEVACPAVWELTPLANWIPANVLHPAIRQ